MSTTTTLPNIAIAGATGYLGTQVLKILTESNFRSSFNEVIVLKRRKDSDPPETETNKDADATTTSSSTRNPPPYTTRYYSPTSLSSSLQNIQILINTIGPTGHAFKDSLLSALPSTSVNLYIPSEFGVDHTTHDFHHPEWSHKKHHFNLANQILPSSIKTCRVFIGLFTEASIGPWFAFDTKNAVYEAVGSADVPVSFTSLTDTALVIASLASLPLDQVPPQIHVASDTLTIRSLAQIMEGAGSPPIKINAVELNTYKTDVLEEGTSDPSKYLRFLMGEGKINHSAKGLGNDNELVNPGGKLWKWKSMKDYAEETKGRPWADYEWDAESVKQ